MYDDAETSVTPETGRRWFLGSGVVLLALLRRIKLRMALLTCWAIDNGLDEPLGPEDPADAEIVAPKVYKLKIKLGRLRRAGIVS